jgi:hypothetical protein
MTTDPSCHRGARNKPRLLSFWAFVIFLVFLWLQMRTMGQGSTPNRLIGFAPLVRTALLFLFVLVADRALKRRSRIKS